MVSFTSLALAALAATGALTAPTTSDDVAALEKRQSTPNGQGTHDGYFWSWWSDGGSPATYTNLAGGGYSVQWQSGGNVVGGKGWQPGLRERCVLAPLTITHPHALTGSPQVHPVLGHVPAQRQQLPGRVRLDAQPAGRVLHRRELRHV